MPAVSPSKSIEEILHGLKHDYVGAMDSDGRMVLHIPCDDVDAIKAAVAAAPDLLAACEAAADEAEKGLVMSLQTYEKMQDAIALAKEPA